MSVPNRIFLTEYILKAMPTERRFDFQIEYIIADSKDVEIDELCRIIYNLRVEIEELKEDRDNLKNIINNRT